MCTVVNVSLRSFISQLADYLLFLAVAHDPVFPVAFGFGTFLNRVRDLPVHCLRQEERQKPGRESADAEDGQGNRGTEHLVQRPHVGRDDPADPGEDGGGPDPHRSGDRRIDLRAVDVDDSESRLNKNQVDISL